VTTQRALAPGELVGRQEELASLDAALASAAAGTGRLVLLEGPPGIGKTAVAEAAAARARSAWSADVVWGRCWDDGAAPAYWPWSQVVRTLPRPDDSGPLSVLLDAPAAAPSCVGGEDARLVLFEAVVGQLARGCAERPLLIVLDDLHAADVASLVLLRFVARQLHALRCVILATSRHGELHAPDVKAGLGELARDAHVLTLGGLELTELAGLVQRAVGMTASTHLVAMLHEATEGNPYHAKELLRLLRAEGRLSQAWDRDVPLPPSVGQALRRRLEPLAPDVRAVLECASVLGREFDLPSLSVVAGCHIDQLLHAVDVAAAHHLLSPLPRAPGRMAFSHALTRDAVYGGIPLSRRTQLHAAAGEALQAAGTTSADMLAHHFTAAAALDSGRRGFACTLDAVDHALARHGYEHAATLARSALQLAPLAAPAPDALAELHVRLGTALMKAGDLPAGRAEHLRAVELARERNDPRLLALAVLGYGDAPVEGGLVDGTLVALLEEALERSATDEVALRARLLARLAHELLFSREVERRRRLGAQALELAADTDDLGIQAEVLRRVIGASIGPDTPQTCLEMTDQLLAVSRRAGAVDLEAEALARRCNWLLELGRAAEFHAAAARVAELATTLPAPQVRWFAAVLGVVRSTMRGQLAEAARAADEAWQDFPALPNAAGAWAVAKLTGSVVLRSPPPTAERWEALCRDVMQSRPGIRHAYGSGLAMILVLDGRRAEGGQLLQSLVDELPELPRDAQYVVTLGWCALVAVELDDARLALTVLESLAPFAGRHCYASMAVPVAYVGPVDLFLGRLATVVGRYDDADRWLASALSAALQLDAAPWVPLIWTAQARLLGARNGPGDGERARTLLADAAEAARALGADGLAALAEDALDGQPGEAADASPALLEEGDNWTVSFQGRTTRHRAGKGFRYLRVLLEQPQQEVHALDLVAAVEGTDRTSMAVDSDVGPQLDERARTEYRRRLEELRDDIADAEADADTARAARAREEFEFLTDELRSALGLGGRDRRAGGHAEQARSSVTKLLRRLMDRLEPEQPELVRHLRATVRTGYFCSYADDSERVLPWRLR
jgi:tetratricopeptide (TPR) repeat protein